MKKMTVCLFILFFFHISWADQVSILFNEETYVLRSVSESSTNAINKYLPLGESLDNWKSTLNLHVDKKSSRVSPLEFARQLGASLKNQNPKSNFQVYGNGKDNEAMIDFLSWKQEINDQAEFNALKIKKDNKTGYLIILQFVKQIKPSVELKDINAFKDKRANWLKALAMQTFPPFVNERSFNTNTI